MVCRMGKLTGRQEAFCQKYVECGNASEAYRVVFASTRKDDSKYISKRADVIMKGVGVAERIAELRAHHAQRHDVTIDTITQELIEDREFARQQGNSGAAITATLGKAKLHGLMTDKSEHKVTLRVEDARHIIETLGRKYLGGGE